MRHESWIYDLLDEIALLVVEYEAGEQTAERAFAVREASADLVAEAFRLEGAVE